MSKTKFIASSPNKSVEFLNPGKSVIQTKKTSLQKYPAYKDSGVEWLGEIPEHWMLGKLGTILKPVSIKNRAELPLLSITREEGVIKRDIEDESTNHNFIPDDLSGYKVVRVGQFGMNKMKAWQGSYGISQYTGIVSPAYYVFDFNAEINPRFFHYAVRSRNYVAFFGQASDGVRIGQWDLSKTRMKEIPFFIPKYEEQTAIAAFLDDKTTKIDTAIAQKEKMIELLKERKQIIIQDLVTGKKVWNKEENGWTAPVAVKDSGVEWMGVIPEDWEVVANRVLFKERKEPGRDDLPLLSVSIHSAVSSEELSDEVNIRGLIKIEDKSNYKYVDINDIVFNMMRAWQGAIGAVSIEGMVSPAYVVAKPNDMIIATYFEYQYRTDSFIQQMSRNSKGITDFRKRLYWDEFKQLQTLVPPRKKQIEIINGIKTQATKIDQAISLQQTQIEKLKEYKTTLIDSAVTGKIMINGEL